MKKFSVLFAVFFFFIGGNFAFADCSLTGGTVTDSDVGFGLVTQDVAGSFVAGCTGTVTTVTARIKWESSDPANNVILHLQTDAGGVPSNTDVTNGVSTGVASGGTSGSYTNVDFTFPSASLTSGSTYWLVYRVDAGRDNTVRYDAAADNTMVSPRRAVSTPNLTTWSAASSYEPVFSGTIITGGGGGGSSTSTVFTATTTQMQSGDIEYELAWIIFYMSVFFIGFLWNTVYSIIRPYGSH